MKSYDYEEADDYYDIGCQWMKEKQYLKAMEAFRHAINLNPRFIYAYIDLASAYFKMGRVHESIQVLHNALFYDRNFHRLHYLLAKYYYREGDYKGALHSIDRAIDLDADRLYKRVRKLILKRLSEKL